MAFCTYIFGKWETTGRSYGPHSPCLTPGYRAGKDFMNVTFLLVPKEVGNYGSEYGPHSPLSHSWDTRQGKSKLYFFMLCCLDRKLGKLTP